MRKTLQISSALSLPLDAVTQTFAILAKRGVGKSYTASVSAEEMLSAKAQIAVLDPTGAWWGLRAGSDGKKEGLSIVVFGGKHGDLPLNAQGGKIIAELVVKKNVSVIIDLSLLRKGEQTRFVTDFAEELFHLNDRPLHLFIDEAHTFAPQRVMPDMARCLGAIEDIVTKGRIKGLGVTMITQRPATLNKNVLTQIEVLIVMRLTSPQDRKAIEEWIDIHGDRSEGRAMIDSLASLDIGTAWIWSPGWLELDVPKKIRIRSRFTYDSSSTPKAGERKRAPGKLADVDMKELKEQLGEVIQQAEANDPRALRKRIAELESDLKKKQPAPAAPPKEVVVEVPVLSKHEVKMLEKIEGTFVKSYDDILGVLQIILKKRQEHNAKPGPWQREHFFLNPPTDGPIESLGRHRRVDVFEKGDVLKPGRVPAGSVPNPNPTLVKPEPPSGSADISRPRKEILNVLASFQQMGITSVDRSNVAVFAGASPTSSGYQNNLGAMRSLGLIDYPRQGEVCITEEGMKHADPGEPIRSVAELHRRWKAKLSAPRGAILDVLTQIYPSSIAKDKLAEQVNQSFTSSGYQNNLGGMRSLGIIDYPTPGYVAATPLLFPRGLA